MKKILILLFALVAVVSAQSLIIENAAERLEYDLDALRHVEFCDLDTLSNCALSFHTVTGIRQIKLTDIDSLVFVDSTHINIFHSDTVTAFRRIDIDYIDLSQVTLPNRKEDARTGSEFMNDMLGTTFQEREPHILSEFLNGNIPDISRQFITVTSDFRDINGTTHTVEYDVMTDYLSIGTNEDYCRIPMGPSTAQAIADAYGCILTTTKLCDDVWSHASVKLSPIPYAPVGDNNSQVYKFVEHNTDIDQARDNEGGRIDELIAGIKKDVVICNAIQSKPGYVAIYGWHYKSGSPIQPLYTGHVDWYVDYSHGIRLVNDVIRVDGVKMNAHDILKDPVLYKLLSNESSPMTLTRYRY